MEYTMYIRASGISKSYGNKVLFSDVNITALKGQSIALVGHNGSGKSTLLRILAGITNATSGKIYHESKIKLQYIPERFPKINMSPQKYIRYMGQIEGLTRKNTEKISQKLFGDFFMENMQNTPMKHLSKGSLQKVAVIQALLTKPSVLLLDEPLSGQDIESQNVFVSLINDLKKEGCTIIMSCHEKFLINRISDTLFEIKDGHVSQVHFSKKPFEEYSILVFGIDKEKPSFLIEEYDGIESVVYEKSQVKVVVSSNKSNDVLLKCLKNGFELREMYNENR